MKIPTAKGRGFPFLLWHIILTSAGPLSARNRHKRPECMVRQKSRGLLFMDESRTFPAFTGSKTAARPGCCPE